MSGASPGLAAFASRLARGALAAVVALMALAVVLAILLWEADLYTARDKYERAKLALLGNWQPVGWCPPGRVSDDCETVQSFEAALEAASDFTFFKSAPIAGTELVVQTGLSFATARDVVDGVVARQWCYLTLPGSPDQPGISRRVDLAAQSAEDPPVYPDLTGLDVPALAGTGLDPDRLTSLAQSHCHFDPIWRD